MDDTIRITKDNINKQFNDSGTNYFFKDNHSKYGHVGNSLY